MTPERFEILRARARLLASPEFRKKLLDGDHETENEFAELNARVVEHGGLPTGKELNIGTYSQIEDFQ